MSVTAILFMGVLATACARGPVASPRAAPASTPSANHTPAPSPAPVPTAADGARRFVAGGEIPEPKAIRKVVPDLDELGPPWPRVPFWLLEVTIEKDGRVSRVHVLKGDDGPATRVVVDAIRQWRFEPVTVDGKPIAVKYVLMYRLCY